MKTSFDTITASCDSKWRPDPASLRDNGAVTLLSQYTGEPYRIIVNPPQNSKEPRITVTLRPNAVSIIQAEVSVGEWRNNSNLHASDQQELHSFLEALSDFVQAKLGIPFCIEDARIIRADIFRDLPVGATKALQIIKDLANRQIPKYNTHLINGRTVRFDNEGPRNGKQYRLHKRIQFYQKQHQLIKAGADHDKIALAEGILRCEIQHRSNRAVAQLAASYKLPNHSAMNILNVDLAERLMDKELMRLKLKPVVERVTSGIETLFANYDFTTAQTLIAHLTTKASYGPDYARHGFVTVSDRTIRKRERMCADLGVLSL